jgi:hypothetical protein
MTERGEQDAKKIYNSNLTIIKGWKGVWRNIWIVIMMESVDTTAQDTVCTFDSCRYITDIQKHRALTSWETYLK